jgi:hypothetical protein
MIYVSLRRWSGQFHIPGVTGKIRRVITSWVELEQCVCVCDDGAKGITPEVRQAIEKDMPPEKVRFSRVHPLANIVLSPRRRRSERRK